MRALFRGKRLLMLGGLLFIGVFLLQLLLPNVIRSRSQSPASEPGFFLKEGETKKDQLQDQARPAGLAPQESRAPAQLASSPTVGNAYDPIRKVIFNASLTIEVKKLSETYQSLLARIESWDGYVFNSSFSDSGSRYKSAQITLHVPSASFHQALAGLETLGKVRQKEISGTDVTAEFVDLESRLRNLTKVEARFLALLQQARNIAEILTVEREVDKVQAEIEQIKGRLKVLSVKSAMATLTLSLTEAPLVIPTVKEPFLVSLGKMLSRQVKDAAREAARALVGAIGVMIVLLIWGIAFLIPAALAVLAARKIILWARGQRLEVGPRLAPAAAGTPAQGGISGTEGDR